MKYLNMDKAIKRYNGIMMDVCWEHSTIGTQFSEGTECWNLRDMVAECDYVLSCYYEEGNVRCDMKRDDRKTWLSEIGKLERFIEAYKPFIKDMDCYEGHYSKFD